MRIILWTLATLLLAGSAWCGELSGGQLDGQIYFSALTPASGGTKRPYSGAGVGYRLPNGFKAGVELGHLYLSEKGTNTAAFTASYHKPFFDWLEPFATAGYTHAYGSASANLFHFGGGITHWLNRRVGLRLEVRDHIGNSLWPSRAPHTLEYRIAVTFR